MKRNPRFPPPSHLRYDKKTRGVGEKKWDSVARLADFF